MLNVLFLILTAQITFAADSLNTTIHNQYNSFRALGMGNAFTAVADDYSLLFYNPAGLAKKKKGEIQFTIAGAGVSAKTTKLVKDIDDASKSATTESAKAQAISDALEPYYGVPLGGRVQALEFFWVRPNWGIALLPLDLTIDIGVHRQLGPALDLNIKKDTTIAYGYGTHITDTLAAGATFKFIHRDSVEQAVSALELASDSDILSSKRFKEGTNLDFDLGFMWSPHWFTKSVSKETDQTDTPPAETIEKKRKVQSEEIVEAKDDPAVELVLTDEEPKPVEKPKPIEKSKVVAKNKKKKKEIAKSKETTNDEPLTFSLVVRNVVSAAYTKSTMINKDALEAPSNNPRVVDIGSNYEFARWDGLTFRATLDFRNLMHPNSTFRKSTHAGFEMDYSPNGWFKSQLRAGLNQMYFTAGATFLFGILEIDAVTYGEEVGTTTSNIENRVNAIKVGMNF